MLIGALQVGEKGVCVYVCVKMSLGVYSCSHYTTEAGGWSCVLGVCVGGSGS